MTTQWLAEMIMSDCGCSTQNQTLLARITTRIEQYDRANAAPTQPAQQNAQVPVAWRRREKGATQWQYFGWQETGMSHELISRWNNDGFECEAILAPPSTEQHLSVFTHR